MRLMCLLAMVGYLLVPKILLADNDRLYVHVPLLAKAYTVQGKISSLCPNLSVTVFGRGKDFYNAMKVSPAGAILSLPSVIDQQPAYKPILQGYKNNQWNEAYVLVSVNKPIDVDKLSNKKIGVVDILGRKEMTKFMTLLFKQKIKLNRVIKRMDLLPLLAYELVNAIFVSEREYLRLLSTTELNLVSTSLNIRQALVKVAMLDKAKNNNDYLKCIKTFDSNLNLSFGVDEWRLLP